MPTINLMDKYADKLELLMKRNALVWGKAKGGYDWTGVNKVKSITPVTQTPNDYNPAATAGTSRFGTLTEVEDSLHEYTLQYSKSNNMSIDKQYNTEQKMLKRASTILKYEINQEYVPMRDKHCLAQYAGASGVVVSVDGSLTKANIAEKFTQARKSFVNENKFGTGKDLVCWIRSTDFEKVILCDNFKYWDKIGTQALVTGSVGKIANFSIIEVPDSYMPTDVNFICANLNVLMNPSKFNTLRILTEHPDVDGAVLQPHFRYGAFVEAANAKGVYVSRSQAASV